MIILPLQHFQKRNNFFVKDACRVDFFVKDTCRVDFFRVSPWLKKQTGQTYLNESAFPNELYCASLCLQYAWWYLPVAINYFFFKIWPRLRKDMQTPHPPSEVVQISWKMRNVLNQKKNHISDFSAFYFSSYGENSSEIDNSEYKNDYIWKTKNRKHLKIDFSFVSAHFICFT